MFVKEAFGLAALANTHCITIPKVIATNTINNWSYLLLEYIPTGTKGQHFWETFGHQMAKLHKNTNATFGLGTDNYIGSLPQYNGFEYNNAAEFYIQKRLLPQFQMAATSGYTFENLDLFFKNINHEIPDEPPALIHGDLWSGNFLVSNSEQPVLIDPAVAYAPREMDIAMMHLFGGFSPLLFHAYHDVFPLAQGWKNRLEIWQLYYLLVHLNLFGSSYLGSVKNIINNYC